MRKIIRWLLGTSDAASQPIKVEVLIKVEGTVNVRNDAHRNDAEGSWPMAVSQRDAADATLPQGKLASAIAEQKLTDLQRQFAGQDTVAGLGQEAK